MDELGGLDVVVNGASAGFTAKRFEDVTESDVDEALGATVKGSFFVTQAAAPHLRATGGLVVMIEDVGAYQPWPSFAAHCAAVAGRCSHACSRARSRRRCGSPASHPGRSQSRPTRGAARGRDRPRRIGLARRRHRRDRLSRAVRDRNDDRGRRRRAAAIRGSQRALVRVRGNDDIDRPPCLTRPNPSDSRGPDARGADGPGSDRAGRQRRPGRLRRALPALHAPGAGSRCGGWETAAGRRTRSGTAFAAILALGLELRPSTGPGRRLAVHGGAERRRRSPPEAAGAADGGARGPSREAAT